MVCYNQISIMRRSEILGMTCNIAVIPNHFPWIAWEKRNRLGQLFTRRRFLQTFVALRQTGAKWRRKKRANFLSPKQRIVSPTSREPISVKFEHQTWMCDIFVNSKQNCEFFSDKDYLPPKTSFEGVFFSTLPARALQPWPVDGLA